MRARTAGPTRSKRYPSRVFATLLDEQRLGEVPGIGLSITRRIGELASTGRAALLDELREELPASIVELAGLPSLSLAKARALSDALGVRTVDDLERACIEERVRTVRGFGERTERKILIGIGEYELRANRILLVVARALADRLARHVEHSGLASRVVAAGDVRRWAETTDEVSIVAETNDAAALLDAFATFPAIARIEQRTDSDAVGRLTNGARVSLHAASPERFAITLLRRTGAAAHIDALATRASDRDLPLDAHAFRSEEEICASVDLVFVPPELREGNGEIAEASRRASPFSLLEEGDLERMVHCHSVFSDGGDTIAAMAEKADALGLTYLTITDHSPSAHYASGVTIDRLKGAVGRDRARPRACLGQAVARHGVRHPRRRKSRLSRRHPRAARRRHRKRSLADAHGQR